MKVMTELMTNWFNGKKKIFESLPDIPDIT